MAAKKSTTSRKPARAKATKKTVVRNARKAPAVGRLGTPVYTVGNPDVVGLP